MHESREADDDEPDVMTAMLGPKPPAATQEVEDFIPRIAERGGPVAVLNDEAHHTHDEESEWNKTIRRLHAATPGGLAAQLDFTATPRHTKGQLFSWTVYDYPLKQAIIDNIVKRPLKGVAKGIAEQPSEMASTRYQAYLAAGVERWKEYRDQLAPLGRKPVLFVMMNDTAEADDVGDWLQKKYPAEFGGDRLLIIHTNRAGEVAVKDLDQARAVARDVDSGASPVSCIVSVVMLREGWDVQSVTVIVGLRPYTAKAAILPEQTVGRGLRLMFRDDRNGYVERVDVIGNRKFIEFVEQLEKEEDMQLDEFEIGKDKVSIVTIEPMADKADKDIALPQLSPILERKKSLADEIAGLDVMAFTCPVLPRKEGDKAAREFRYEAHDLITLQKLIERDYTIPAPQTAEEVIGYYARRIAQDVKLPSQFAALVPKVREFLEQKAFGGPVDISTPDMVKAISNNVVQYVTVKTFTAALRDLVVQELEPTLLNIGRSLSETPKFPWSRKTLTAKKCIFNLVACDNELEKDFARFLEAADDVERFAKLPERFGFVIEYIDPSGNLRFYEPDFVAVTTDGASYLVETKGMEDVNVANKDRAAQALVRERNEADREAVGLPEGAREGIQAAPAEPFRRSDFSGSQIERADRASAHLRLHFGRAVPLRTSALIDPTFPRSFACPDAPSGWYTRRPPACPQWRGASCRSVHPRSANQACLSFIVPQRRPLRGRAGPLAQRRKGRISQVRQGLTVRQTLRHLAQRLAQPPARRMASAPPAFTTTARSLQVPADPCPSSGPRVAWRVGGHGGMDSARQQWGIVRR